MKHKKKILVEGVCAKDDIEDCILFVCDEDCDLLPEFQYAYKDTYGEEINVDDIYSVSRIMSAYDYGAKKLFKVKVVEN